MTTLYVDSAMPEEQRRDELYRGQLFVFSPRPASLALAGLARELLEEAFAPYDPREAQYHFAVERYAEILAELKPRFIHHPRCKSLIPQVLAEHGADPETTYFDVPRLRSSTAQGYLTTGIAYAFHPHRDTWYSAPHCQLNWWLPVYPFESESSFSFHQKYWNEPVPNSSNEYNHYEWNKTGRANASKEVKTDTRK